jgi:hypothetical protein
MLTKGHLKGVDATVYTKQTSSKLSSPTYFFFFDLCFSIPNRTVLILPSITTKVVIIPNRIPQRYFFELNNDQSNQMTDFHTEAYWSSFYGELAADAIYEHGVSKEIIGPTLSSLSHSGWFCVGLWTCVSLCFDQIGILRIANGAMR